MKKFLGLLAAGIGGYALWIKIQQEKQDRAIWTEVTDTYGEAAANGPTR